MSSIEQYDRYLQDDGPAALVIREHLMPVEGPDGVIFPPTFAAADGFPGGYNTDGDPNGENVCIIDTVGSQANRMEPIFATEPYNRLVPQVTIKAGENVINLLEAGHRAGDAIIRCTNLATDIQNAFNAVLDGDAEPLAKIAPTSLVFGVWDSRDTQAKLPRLIASTIRAYNVRSLTRSAQFVPAVEYVREKLLKEPTDKTKKKAYAERGYIHVPACGTPGGVIATGGIRRDAVLGLAALRLLSTGSEEQTLALRRYILGLALVAFSHCPSRYLRQGCLLVLDPDKPRELSEVCADGRRKPIDLNVDSIKQYAKQVAEKFGVGEGANVEFDRKRAEADTTSKKKTRANKADEAQAGESE